MFFIKHCWECRTWVEPWKISIFIQARTRAKVQRQNTHTHQKDPVQRWRTWGHIGKLWIKIMAFILAILGEKLCYLTLVYSTLLNLSVEEGNVVFISFFIGNFKIIIYRIWLTLFLCTFHSIISQNFVLKIKLGSLQVI